MLSTFDLAFHPLAAASGPLVSHDPLNTDVCQGVEWNDLLSPVFYSLRNFNQSNIAHIQTHTCTRISLCCWGFYLMQPSEQSTHTNWPISLGISHGGGSCSHYCCSSSLRPEHWLTSWLAGWPGRGGYEVKESLQMKQPHHYPTKTIVHTYFPLMTHTLALRPITHQPWRRGWQAAFSALSLINPCRCLSAKLPCQMKNACAAFKAICQRALGLYLQLHVPSQRTRRRGISNGT